MKVPELVCTRGGCVMVVGVSYILSVLSLCTACVVQSDFTEFSAALDECGADLMSLTYLKKWK